LVDMLESLFRFPLPYYLVVLQTQTEAHRFGAVVFSTSERRKGWTDWIFNDCYLTLLG
jgi:hypothetical protein